MSANCSKCQTEKCWRRRRFLVIVILTLSLTSTAFFIHLEAHMTGSKIRVTFSLRKWWPNPGDFVMPCNIPQLDPFDPSVMQFMQTPAFIDCQIGHPFIFKSDLKSNDSILIQIVDPGHHSYSNCCYVPFQHKIGTKDGIVQANYCTPIKSKQTKIDSLVEFIEIRCLQNGLLKTIDMLSFIPMKPEVEKKLQKWNKIKKNMDISGSVTSEKNQRVNIVILSLDSVSHAHFIRKMPLTHDYLTKNLSAYWMDGYTKVGDNTFPALIPGLTGMLVEELEDSCWNGPSGRFDECRDFIWNNYAEKGYLTFFGEDTTNISLFLWQKDGFHVPPTDYYLHPMTGHLDRLLGRHRLSRDSRACYGPRLSFYVLLNHVKAMAASSHRRNSNYFQLMLATSMFHDNLNKVALGDAPLRDTLKWLANREYLNDTVFILMSDHGQRGGPIRQTRQGYFEDRMPLLYFVLPPTFMSKNVEAMGNLLKNRKRLVTTFDLHETLKDLLEPENLEDESVLEGNLQMAQLSTDLPRGLSLFSPIPEMRTCQSAGIEENWCVCREMAGVSQFENNALIREGALHVVNAMNKIVKNFKLCAKLTLDKVNSVQIIRSENGDLLLAELSQIVMNEDYSRLEHLDVSFSMGISVLPSGGTFETTVTRKIEGKWDLGGEISRTNLYGDQSFCVNDYLVKKYCFCTNQTNFKIEH